MVSPQTAQTPVLFRSVHRPRCNAGPRQSHVVVALVAGALGVAGMAFVLAGAWPVIGFFGLEVGLLYGALRYYRGAARASESLYLTDRELMVTRIDRRGRCQNWSFQPYWLRVSLVGRRHERIELRSHGRSVFIGEFLASGERERLAADLVHALAPLSVLSQPALPRPRSDAPCAPCRPAPV